MTEPEVIRTLRQDVRDGNVFLHDKHNEIVCATSVILQAYDALRAERDALRTDNAVLSEEIHMQLIELGMKRIGDHMSQYFRADDECGDAAMAVQPITGDTK